MSRANVGAAGACAGTIAGSHSSSAHDRIGAVITAGMLRAHRGNGRNQGRARNAALPSMRAAASIAAMKELLVQAVPYLPVTLLALTLVLLAPYVGEVGRRRIVLFFAVAAIGLIVLGVRSAGTEVKLDVVNPFPVDSNMKEVLLHIETVTASGWQWPIAAAAFCGFVALLVFG